MSRGNMLFSAPMVNAIRAGNKTQTRRAVNPQPVTMFNNDGEFGQATGWLFRSGGNPCTVSGEPVYVWDRIQELAKSCPYGQPGELISVRETFYAWGCWEQRYSEKKGRDEWHFVDQTIETGNRYHYAATETPHSYKKGNKRTDLCSQWWKRPAIFMPLSATRITLEITAIRVERLLNISEKDALAEGITSEYVIVGSNCHGGYHQEEWAYRYFYEGCSEEWFEHPDDAYLALWESINGKESLDSDPFVWVIEFTVKEGLK